MLLISANETELVDLWSAAMAITVFRVLSGNVLHEITENGGGDLAFSSSSSVIFSTYLFSFFFFFLCSLYCVQN